MKEESEKAGLKFSIQWMKNMTFGSITSWQTDGEKVETVTDFIFLGSKITMDGAVAMKLKDSCFLEGKLWKLRQHVKKQRYTLPTKVCLVKAMVFPIVMYGYESWTIKLSAEELMLLNCSVGEDSWESLGLQEIQSVNPKGYQLCIFIGNTGIDAEGLILWLPGAKRRLIWKDPDAGKDWGWEKKVVTEEEMVEWPHRFNGHEFEQALGDNEGQGSLECYSPWGYSPWANSRTRLNDWTTTTYKWNHVIDHLSRYAFSHRVIPLRSIQVVGDMDVFSFPFPFWPVFWQFLSWWLPILVFLRNFI